MRAGYMGHLTFISDEIMKLFEGYPETIVNVIKDHIDINAWNAYCNNELKETKDRDQLPLGGLRPNDEIDVPQSDEEDDDDALDGVAASQYSRFMAQRGEEGNFDDEDEDENDHWITGRDDFNRGEYNFNGTGFTMSGKNDGQDTHGVEDEEDDYNSNDEEVSFCLFIFSFLFTHMYLYRKMIIMSHLIGLETFLNSHNLQHCVVFLVIQLTMMMMKITMEKNMIIQLMQRNQKEELL